MGLKASGSIDYSCEDLFVPESYTYDVTTRERHGGALCRMGLANMSGINHAGWALGVGRRMLDEMRTLAQKKSGTPGTSVDTDQFAAEYATAEATLRSARAFVFEVWRDNETTLDGNELLSRTGNPDPPSTEQRHLVRPRGLHDGLQVGSHGGTPARRSAALLPGYARRNTAHDLRTGGVAVLRQDAGGPGQERGMGLFLPRRKDTGRGWRSGGNAMNTAAATSAVNTAHFTTRVGSVGTEDMLSADDFKAAFRNHPAGVAVITADAGDGPVGLTATSVISVSASPALLVFSLSAFSSSAPALAKAETLVVHLLGADQRDWPRHSPPAGSTASRTPGYLVTAGYRRTGPAQRPHLAARPDRGPNAGW
jgi:hypothetical protein